MGWQPAVANAPWFPVIVEVEFARRDGIAEIAALVDEVVAERQHCAPPSDL